MDLIVFRAGDDTSWYVVTESLYDKIEAIPFEDGFDYVEAILKKIIEPSGDLKEGVISHFTTQDFVTEEVNLSDIKRIKTLPSY